MKKLTVSGGARLSGEIGVHGSKNAALPILFSCLLFSEPVELTNLPAITDVETALTLLSSLGVKVTKTGRGRVTLDPSAACSGGCDLSLSGSLRGSLYLLGASCGRFPGLIVPRPGGCNFGARPIDLHLEVLRAMGLSVSATEEGVFVKGRPKGACFDFPTVSVGATVNAILAATAAEGRTVLTGAAREPHVNDLIEFLCRAGARIASPSPGTVVVDGGARLHGVSHRVCPDMIEAGTYLLFTMATGGEITLRSFPPNQLAPLLPLLSGMGAKIGAGVDSLYLCRSGRLRPVSVSTAPYPGFPTDLQPQLTALSCLADGESVIADPVFPTRFGYVSELSEMGARIAVANGRAVISGGARLRGRTVAAPDLRAGAALTLAALFAEGESVIGRFDLIERGYADYVRDLVSLGARVKLADGDA